MRNNTTDCYCRWHFVIGRGIRNNLNSRFLNLLLLLLLMLCLLVVTNVRGANCNVASSRPNYQQWEKTFAQTVMNNIRGEVA